MITDSFKKFGLTTNESNTLLALMELGRSAVTPLSRKLSLPRPTVYSILESLKNKGLVMTEGSKRAQLFVAHHPSSFQQLVAARRKEVAELAHAAEDIEKSLAPFFRSEDAHVPKLTFYEGEKNVAQLLRTALPEWERSLIAEDRTLWGYQDPSFVTHYTPWLKAHWKRNEERSLQVKLFSNSSVQEQNLKGKVRGREIRTLPVAFQFRSSIWVCGEYLILLVTHKKPHYAFQIRDRLLSSNLRDLFKLLWSQQRI